MTSKIGLKKISRHTCVWQHYEACFDVAQVDGAGALYLRHDEVAGIQLLDNVHAVNGSTAPAATTTVGARATSNDGAAVICQIN